MKIATRFEKAIDCSQMSLNQLADSVEANVNVRTRLLTMANSAHAGRARRISKVSDALLVLGADCVTNYLEMVKFQ